MKPVRYNCSACYLRKPMYKILRSILFLLPAETAHYLSMNLLKAACAVEPLRRALLKAFSPSQQHSLRFLQLPLKNPVGLGAGFDKNAKYLRELEVLGFGFVEIGTVTPLAQAGNKKPRLFRLPKDGALVNRMGFNNEGLEKVRIRLHRWQKAKLNNPQQSRMLIGGNIGKNKSTPNEEAWKDYETCFTALHSYVDFFVVNVSSPNTPGLRQLQEKESLRKILVHLQLLNKKYEQPKPILLKIAPDLELAQIDDVIDLAREINLDGLVATNTTVSRANLQTAAHQVETIGQGGVSGRPLQKRSTEVLRYINEKSGGAFPLIGSGGIFTAEDAKEKMAAGAALVEVWTGFIYVGPSIVKNICSGLGTNLPDA